MDAPDDAAVDELLALLDRRRPLLTTTPPGTARQLAAGGLTRAEGLLRGLLLVVTDGREDLAGLFTRAVWECWCVALYLLLGGPDALAELHESHRRWIRHYAEVWPDEAGPGPEVDPEYLAAVGSSKPTPTVEVMAERVEGLLRTADTGPVRYGNVSSYDVFYRLESTFSAHAGLALFERYLTASPEGLVEAIEAVPRHDTLRLRAASLAGAYIAHPASHVYRAFGISVAEVDGLLIRLAGSGGMLTSDD